MEGRLNLRNLFIFTNIIFCKYKWVNFFFFKFILSIVMLNFRLNDWGMFIKWNHWFFNLFTCSSATSLEMAYISAFRVGCRVFWSFSCNRLTFGLLNDFRSAHFTPFLPNIFQFINQHLLKLWVLLNFINKIVHLFNDFFPWIVLFLSSIVFFIGNRAFILRFFEELNFNFRFILWCMHIWRDRLLNDIG